MKAIHINAMEIQNENGDETLVFMTSREFEFIKRRLEKLNNILEDLKEDIPCLLEIINRNKNEIKVYQDEWIAIRSIEEELKELKVGDNNA